MERRDFLKVGALFTLSAVVSSCAPSLVGFDPTATNTPTEIPPSPTGTSTPTETATTEPKSELEMLKEKYGTAKGVPVFEFHGDSYRMYDGLYEMNPESFKSQMEWLRDNEFHSVTCPELVGFLNGTTELPSRSVILSTDSGNGSLHSMPRVLEVLQETGMHMQSYIWTMGMTDEAWKMFDGAVKTGLVTIGTHTMSHGDLATFSLKQGLNDLLGSRKLIEGNLGISVYGISWPLESVPEWSPKLKDYGFEYGLAGWSREAAKLVVYKEDKERFNLPRIFPPNPNGKSGRPQGLTLPEIMTKFTGQEFDTQK